MMVKQLSLRPYLIREMIDVVSIERTGMAGYPFNWERLMFVKDESEAERDARDDVQNAFD